MVYVQNHEQVDAEPQDHPQHPKHEQAPVAFQEKHEYFDSDPKRLAKGWQKYHLSKK